MLKKLIRSARRVWRWVRAVVAGWVCVGIYRYRGRAYCGWCVSGPGGAFVFGVVAAACV